MPNHMHTLRAHTSLNVDHHTKLTLSEQESIPDTKTLDLLFSIFEEIIVPTAVHILANLTVIQSDKPGDHEIKLA